MLHLSLAILVSLCIILQIVRLFALRFCRSDWRLCVEEVLLNVQCSACVMELGVIGMAYGSSSWVLYTSLFIFLVCKFYAVLHGGLIASPLAFIGRYYAKGQTHDYRASTVLCVTLSQIFGCLIGQYVIKAMWKYMSDYHVTAMENVCTSTLATSAMLGALAEGSGVFIGVFLSIYVPHKWNPLTGAALTVILLSQFGHFSGLWMNPMLATAHTFRCKGHTSDWEHLVVYWIGPILGCVLANESSRIITRLASKEKLV